MLRTKSDNRKNRQGRKVHANKHHYCRTEEEEADLLQRKKKTAPGHRPALAPGGEDEGVGGIEPEQHHHGHL